MGGGGGGEGGGELSPDGVLPSPPNSDPFLD